MTTETKKITISVGWSGDDGGYEAEHVNKLYRGVKRNTTVPFEFVLCAGPEAQYPGKLANLESGIRVIESPYYFFWAGYKALEPGVITTDLLTLGLDVVVVGNLDDIFNYPSEMAMMADWQWHPVPPARKNDVNCEVMLFRNGKQKLIWDAWLNAGAPQWDRRTPAEKRVWPMAQQGWINETRPWPVDLFPKNMVASYKMGCKDKGLPEGCRLVSFHGLPKPWHVDDKWVKECWI